MVNQAPSPLSEQQEKALREFHSPDYLRLNQRRQEHLAWMELPLEDRRVWEVSAAIGDHTSYFLDRKCQTTATEVRPDLIDLLRARYPDLEVLPMDLNHPPTWPVKPFDVVYCYGVLYHLDRPGPALKFLAEKCAGMLLLETCVSYDDEPKVVEIAEPSGNPSQALSGRGCRPSRQWIWNELSKYFANVYCPICQPRHEQFPLDWSQPFGVDSLRRSIFVASRFPIRSQKLIDRLIRLQQVQP